MLTVHVQTRLPNVLLDLSTSGPGYSKQTTSLVRVSLKFQKLICQIKPISLVEKRDEKLFSLFLTKNSVYM